MAAYFSMLWLRFKTGMTMLWDWIIEAMSCGYGTGEYYLPPPSVEPEKEGVKSAEKG